MPSMTTHNHVPHHHDAAWLKQAIADGKRPKDIANELQVSYKLVELKLTEFGIPFTSQKPSVVN
jgi:hypothetical protein